MSIQIIISLGTVVFLLVLWAIFGYNHLKNLQAKLKEQWELVDEMLRKRQDLIPLLVETLRACSYNDEVFIKELISQRFKTAHLQKSDQERQISEAKLTAMIQKIMDHSEVEKSLSHEVKFLQIKKHLSSATQSAQDRLEHYNQMIEAFNSDRKSLVWALWSLIFRFKKLEKFTL